MRKIHFISALLIAATLSFTSCNEEALGPSIFDTTPIERTEFDYWLLRHFVHPFNAEVLYRFEDIESDFFFNLTPADLRLSKKLAQIIKHTWLDAYVEVVDSAFLRRNMPRIIQFIGSRALNPDGSEIGGTAEGGLKVTLYNVNGLEMNMSSIRWKLWIIHHEFAHILHQTIMYDVSFREITPAYLGQGWMQINQSFGQRGALERGSITPYSLSAADEDFVEMFTAYILTDADAWESLMQIAEGNITIPENSGWSSDFTGRDAIERKLEILKSYMRDVWGLDMDEMRRVSLRRMQEVLTMEFLTFDGK